MNKYSVSWKRPIHLNHPEHQTDSSVHELPEATCLADAEATIRRWEPWLLANKCFDVKIVEIVPEQKNEFFVTLPQPEKK